MAWQNLAAAGLGLGSSLLGASSAKKAARDQRRLAVNQMEIAGTAYSPINVTGPGGGSVTFGGSGQTGAVAGTDGRVNYLGDGYRKIGRHGIQSDIGSINLNLGDLDPLRSGMVGAAGQLTGQLGLQGLSPLQLLGLGLAGQSASGPDLDLGTLNALSGLAGQTTGMGFNQYQQAAQNPFQQQLMNQLMQGAAGQFADAATGFGDYRNQTLDLLRQEAQPFEDRAFSNLQNNLFSTGRMGSSGGGLQTEAFARGLGQADLTRQLQAGQEARAAQTQALAMGQGLAGQGMGIRGMQDDLLTSALNRFSTSANFAQGLSQDRYNRTLGASQFGIDAGRGLFALGQSALTSPYDVQNAALRNLSGLLGNVGDVTRLGYMPAELANTFMTNQAANRQGQAGIMNLQALTAPQNMNANMWSQLGGALLGSQAGQQGLQSIFGGLGSIFNRGQVGANVGAQQEWGGGGGYTLGGGLA